MFYYRLIFIWLSLLYLTVLTKSRNISENIKAQNVLIVEDIENFLITHPSLRINSLQKQITTRYVLGVKGEDDHLLAQFADTLEYPAKKDVSVDLRYPEKDGITGDILTYIEIETLQDNEDGNAYVVSGGIGQRSIFIILEAKQTEHFSYNAHFYGVKKN
uniref:Uncharacterized protein n=1 Tax=Glossina brevipalpis TaxID=37001 RepID=A0A1A9WAQ0_9MUSC